MGWLSDAVNPVKAVKKAVNDTKKVIDKVEEISTDIADAIDPAIAERELDPYSQVEAILTDPSNFFDPSGLSTTLNVTLINPILGKVAGGVFTSTQVYKELEDALLHGGLEDAATSGDYEYNIGQAWEHYLKVIFPKDFESLFDEAYISSFYYFQSLPGTRESASYIERDMEVDPYISSIAQIAGTIVGYIYGPAVGAIVGAAVGWMLYLQFGDENSADDAYKAAVLGALAGAVSGNLGGELFDSPVWAGLFNGALSAASEALAQQDSGISMEQFFYIMNYIIEKIIADMTIDITNMMYRRRTNIIGTGSTGQTLEDDFHNKNIIGTRA